MKAKEEKVSELVGKGYSVMRLARSRGTTGSIIDGPSGKLSTTSLTSTKLAEEVEEGAAHRTIFVVSRRIASASGLLSHPTSEGYDELRQAAPHRPASFNLP